MAALFEFLCYKLQENQFFFVFHEFSKAQPVSRFNKWQYLKMSHNSKSTKEQTRNICTHQYSQLLKEKMKWIKLSLSSDPICHRLSLWFVFGPKGVKVVLLRVQWVLSYFRASTGSLVPDRLTELRAWVQLKNCLKDEGISLHFLWESEEKHLQINPEEQSDSFTRKKNSVAFIECRKSNLALHLKTQIFKRPEYFLEFVRSQR